MVLPGVPKGPICKPQEEREPQAICYTHMPDSLSACTSKSIFNLKYTLTFILDLISGLIEPQGSMKQLLFNCGLYTNSSEWAVGGRWRGPAESHLTCSVYKGCWVCNIASGSRGTCEQQPAAVLTSGEVQDVFVSAAGLPWKACGNRPASSGLRLDSVTSW